MLVSSHHQHQAAVQTSCKIALKGQKRLFLLAAPLSFFPFSPTLQIEARCENRGRKKLRSCPAVLLRKQLPKRKRVGLRSLLLLLFLAHITCCLLSPSLFRKHPNGIHKIPTATPMPTTRIDCCASSPTRLPPRHKTTTSLSMDFLGNGAHKS